MLDFFTIKYHFCNYMQMGVVVGLGLLVIVGGGLYFGAGVFTKDKNVLHLMY